MNNTSRKFIALLVVTLAPLGASLPAGPNPNPAEGCKLEYRRADNMWAAAGRPDGNLGVETITLGGVNHTQALETDWRYEKMRNDGRKYYGSHLRIAKNVGARQVLLSLKKGLSLEDATLEPGETQQFQHDLWRVVCK